MVNWSFQCPSGSTSAAPVPLVFCPLLKSTLLTRQVNCVYASISFSFFPSLLISFNLSTRKGSLFLSLSSLFPICLAFFSFHFFFILRTGYIFSWWQTDVREIRGAWVAPPVDIEICDSRKYIYIYIKK